MSEKMLLDFGSFTAIPNHFLDRVAPTLSASELRVMLYIYRHTLGFQKLADALSYEQFLSGVTTKDGRLLDRGAGVSRRSLVSALLSLEKRGLITRFHNGYAPATIRVNLEMDDEQVEQKKPKESNTQMEPEAEELQGAMAEGDRKSSLQQGQAQKGGCQTLAANSANVGVQNLHPEEENRVQKSTFTKQSFFQNKQNRVAEAVQPELDINIQREITEKVAGIDLKEAEKLVKIASDNRRDITYLQRLVHYVTNNPSIHTPAAALTALVKSNQDRTLEGRKSNMAGYPQKSRTLALSGPGSTGARKSSIDWSKYAPGGKYGFLASTREVI
ncbi:MAG TPA: hypothetical protein VH186_14005 [Chloroflexia bacterium]|nr:hypothetical protein [Chloroflexia bacterium]